MPRFVIFLFSFFILLLSFNPIEPVAQVGGEVITDIDGDPYFEGTAKTTKGSPILFEKWMIATLTNNKGTTYSDRSIRIDTYKHDLHLKKDDEPGYFILDPNQIEKIVIPSMDIVFKNGFHSSEHDIKKNHFVEIIHEGNVKLIQHFNTKLVESRGVNPITGKNADKYISQENFYLIDSNGNYHDVKLKSKHILKALGGNTKKLEAYADNNNLSFKEKADVAKILSYYESSTEAN